MGSCAGATINSPEKRKRGKIPTLLEEGEVSILHLIYIDLAQRIESSKINLQNFLLFFHKNGYWGERLFHEFDYDETKLISEEQFLFGISKIFKSTQKEKISLLFKFFSQGALGQEGIRFHDFLTMLYNYPKEDLSQILNDKEFIQHELQEHLVPIDHKKTEQGNIYYSLESSTNIRKYLPQQSPSIDLRLQKRFSNPSRSPDKISTEQFPSMLGRQLAKNIQNRHKMSEFNSFLRLNYDNKVLNIKAINIQQLVKMFATRIFKEANVDIKTGKLKFEEFYKWISRHKALYKNYYDGFHNEIWETDRSTSKPKYLSTDCEKCSEAKAFIGDKLISIKLYLHHSILVACRQKSLSQPFLVISLEGLAVRRIFQIQNGFGIEISHRDGVYQDKKFFFKNEELLLEWMALLEFYKGFTVQNKYDIGEQIGRGKFSVVYKCVCLDDGQEYALKQIATYKLDSEAKRLIAHESSIMQVVSHPLLLQFKESIQTKTHLYIITELVKGTDLFDYVKKRDFLNQYEAANICQQLIVGLRFLHSLDIVHRDLKPQNIMVEIDPDSKEIESIKIIDFGFSNYLSKLHSGEGEDDMAGTPNYIAPEILKQQPFDFKIDNFAIGVILFYMLKGSLPFYDVNITETLTNTINGTYQFGDRVLISNEAKDLINKLLKNDPKERISLDKALEHEWFNILTLPRNQSLPQHEDAS